MQEFLKSFPNHLLAVIMPDGKGDNRIYHNISLEEAIELNQIRQKGDIYFTPNGDYQNVFSDDRNLDVRKRNNKGRSKANAQNIYSFIVDIDNKEEVWKNFPGLETPTYIVKTGHGHHLYYVLEKPLLYKDFKSEFEDLEEKLITLLKGDQACKDVSRILRVPGFKYWKDNKGEIEISIKENSGKVFKYKELKGIVEGHYVCGGKDNEERKIITKRIKKNRQLSKSFDDFFDKVQGLNVDNILYDLFGSQYTIQPSGAILENGKKTDGYKFNKRGNYLNSFSENDRPVGGPYSVAKFYYKNTGDVIEYFKKNWNIEFERSIEIIESIYDKKTELKTIGDEKREKIKYGNEVNGIVINFNQGKIIQYYDKGESEYIDGTVESYGYYRNEENTRYIVKTKKGPIEQIKTMPLIGGASELRRFLMGCGLVVGESKQGLVHLLKYITDVKKEYLYTDKLGLQYIDGKKVVITKGGVYIDEEQGVFVDIPEVNGEFLNIDKDNDVEIKDFVKQLIGGYEGTVSFVSFLAMCLGVNSYFFRDNKVKLPQFFLMGLSQTGKTTYLESLFQKGMGVEMEVAASSKPFVYQKMSKHYMPIHFCEYRNTNLNKDDIEGQMRILYDGTEGTKGKSDQSIVHYPSNAMFMLDGQATFTDDAVLTRTFLLIANPRDKGKLSNLLSLPNISNKIINIFKDNVEFMKYIERCSVIRDKLKKKMNLSRENDRMLDNYSYLYGLADMLGLSKYDKYIDSAMSRQDGYLALDDIKMTYQKIFNLQQLHKFGISVYGKGLLIEIVEEYLRIPNLDDLKGFIKTVNQHFLVEDYSFIGMEVYVDLDYIYKNKQLRNPFSRVLSNLVLGSDYTQEEKNTIMGLKEFLDKNFKSSMAREHIESELSLSDFKKKESTKSKLPF